MHSQTEQYIRFGINMMKYAINHHEDFSNPYIATLLGFSYMIVTMLLTMACIVKMCTEYTILDVLNSYISYGVIVFVPNFGLAAFPVGHPMKASAGDLTIKQRRRFIHSRPCGMWILRFNYKFWRIVYASFWYYFLPIVAMLMPFIQVHAGG